MTRAIWSEGDATSLKGSEQHSDHSFFWVRNGLCINWRKLRNRRQPLNPFKRKMTDAVVTVTAFKPKAQKICWWVGCGMWGKAGVKEDSELGIWVGENVRWSKRWYLLAPQGERLSGQPVVKDREGEITSMRPGSREAGWLWQRFIPVTGGRTTDTASLLTGWDKVMSAPGNSLLIC